MLLAFSITFMLINAADVSRTSKNSNAVSGNSSALRDAKKPVQKNKKDTKKKVKVPVRYYVYSGKELIGSYYITKVSVWNDSVSSCADYTGEDVKISVRDGFTTIKHGKGDFTRYETYTGDIRVLSTEIPETSTGTEEGQ